MFTKERESGAVEVERDGTMNRQAAGSMASRGGPGMPTLLLLWAQARRHDHKQSKESALRERVTVGEGWEERNVRLKSGGMGRLLIIWLLYAYSYCSEAITLH